MKKENIITIILLILVIALSGYIIYDKYNSNNLNNNNDTSIKENNNENNDKTNNTTTLNKFKNLFVGNYKYESGKEEECGYEFTKFELKEDGTYTYHSGVMCGSGETASGKYAIGKDKIYLFNNECKVVNISNSCEYPNCSPLYELDYSLTNNDIEIYFNNTNNKKVIYEKQ